MTAGGVGYRWGWWLRAFKEKGRLEDAHGMFRLVPAECLACRAAFVLGEPEGQRTVCPNCKGELVRVHP